MVRHDGPVRGVLTIATHSYFEGLKCLVESIAGQCPVATFDLDFTASQLEFCAAAGVLVLPCPPLVVPKTEEYWSIWNKSLFISNSPFRETLYIDADCIVSGDLTPVFEYISRQMLLIRHQDWSVYVAGNKPYMYGGSLVRRMECSINAGVLGFDLERDALFLGNLVKLLHRVAADPIIREGFGWMDEGMAIWMIESMGLDSLVIDKNEWNHFVFPNDSSSQWPANKAEFLRAIRGFGGGGLIHHFTSKPKYWAYWA